MMIHEWVFLIIKHRGLTVHPIERGPAGTHLFKNVMMATGSTSLAIDVNPTMSINRMVTS